MNQIIFRIRHMVRESISLISQIKKDEIFTNRYIQQLDVQHSYLSNLREFVAELTRAEELYRDELRFKDRKLPHLTFFPMKIKFY